MLYWLTELVMRVHEFSGNSPRSLPVGPRSHECGNKEPKKWISSLNFACNTELGPKKKSVAWSVNDNFVLQKCKLSVVSEYQRVKCGVPQEFIVGHLLFLLYQGYLSLYYLLMTPTSFSQMLISQLKGLVHDNAHVWVLTVADCF